VRRHETPTRYRYRNFEIDEECFSIRTGRRLLQVEPRVLELVFYLVAQRERMVPKGELLANVWKGVAVTASSLNRCVSLARRLLGSRVIRTVYGRGYQWVGAENITTS
jgi:DNA-binding winged helix-turn-helix (wHTH) protein